MILTVNTGSSSYKAALFDVTGRQWLRGFSLDLQQSSWKDESAGTTYEWHTNVLTQTDFIHQIHGRLLEAGCTLKAVSHRFVHGGGDFHQPVVITPLVARQLEGLSDLAPLHMPQAIEMYSAARNVWSDVPHIACFDTGFHHNQPRLHTYYPLPLELYAQGIRHYGFHGLSYEYIVSQLPVLGISSDARIIAAHLGSGSSACAIQHGKSVASSMGFSAVAGMMMATRSGSIDPGIITYLLRQGWNVKRIEGLLYKQSGLLGVSGISSDLRILRKDGGDTARLAIDLYCYRAAQEIAALLPALGGLDVLIFTGGIGQHQPDTCRQIAQHLAWLDIKMLENNNQTLSAAEQLQASSSRVAVWSLPTNEEAVMAKAAIGYI